MLLFSGRGGLSREPLSLLILEETDPSFAACFRRLFKLRYEKANLLQILFMLSKSINESALNLLQASLQVIVFLEDGTHLHECANE